MLRSDGGAHAHNKQMKPLPKMLPGAVCGQRVRCGRPGCKCARGELHGPYFYRFYRDGGRLCKRYVRPGDLDATRRACAIWRQTEQAARNERRDGLRTWRDLLALLREVQRNDR